LDSKFVRRNLWSLIKWAVGVIAFTELAARYHQWANAIWSLIVGLPIPSSDLFWGILGVATVAIGVVLIGSDIASRLRVKHDVAPRPRVKLDTRAYDFVIESTTDWFAIGIEHGQLEAILETDVSEGTIREGDPDLLETKFNVNQTSPKLKVKVVARVRVNSVWAWEWLFDKDHLYSVNCFSEKGNLGSLKIEVFDHESRTFLGDAQYQRTQSPKNPMRFTLELPEHGLTKSLTPNFRTDAKAWPSDQPRLEIALTELEPHEEEVERVEIWLKHKLKRTHHARFCFVTIENTAIATAKNVQLSCGHSMILMPFKGKRDYRVEHEWDRADDFDEQVRNPRIGVEAFVLATLDGFDDEISMEILGGQKKRVVLFFTLKDFPAFCVPCGTRNYYNPRGSPPRESLVLNIHHDNALGSYSAWFDVIMYSWDNFIPKLLKTEFHPFKFDM
jgi:hypothetical protein